MLVATTTQFGVCSNNQLVVWVMACHDHFAILPLSELTF
jgi:hypothetical protein